MNSECYVALWIGRKVYGERVTKGFAWYRDVPLQLTETSGKHQNATVGSYWSTYKPMCNHAHASAHVPFSYLHKI